jgi:hypothetical protein
MYVDRINNHSYEEIIDILLEIIHLLNHYLNLIEVDDIYQEVMSVLIVFEMNLVIDQYQLQYKRKSFSFFFSDNNLTINET